MTSDSIQHSNDYEQLKTTLEQYPGITITLVKGQPPDYFEILYRLNGFVRNPDGNISKAQLHRIQITLPFGYPHFPPTVKPLTHIFHPDIDPAAVRIADQWKKKPNLADLVLTIGNMICGHTFNSVTPFNQEAADWYEQHKDELPLDVLQNTTADDEQGDRADDDSLTFLGLDDDDLLVDNSEIDDDQIGLVRLQLEQNNIFAANTILSNIPQSVTIPDREELELTIATALKNSDKLFKQVEQYEEHGQLDQAAALIEEIESIAADAPGLNVLRDRILQSQSLTESLVPEEKSERAPKKKQSSPPPLPKNNKKKATVSTRSPLPITSILVCTILGLGITAAALLYFQDKKILTTALNDREKIQSLLTQRQFDKAQEGADNILYNLQKLRILKPKATTLTADIQSLLNSDELQQGLQGKVLYNGQYISLAKEEHLKQLATITQQAEQLLKQGKIREALREYNEALHYTRKNDLKEESLEIVQTINNLRFEDAVVTAKKAEQAKEWKNAADTYRRALELSRSFANPEEAAEMTKRLTTATFRHELSQSKQTFTGAQWQETISILEHAQKLIASNPTAISPKEKAELDQLLLNSHLYQMLTLAREAYERRDLPVSIRQYKKALHFLDTRQEEFGPGLEESYKKIEKTLLMMQIAQVQDKIVIDRKANDLKMMIEDYQAILELIRTSQFQKTQELHELSNTINEQLTETKNKLFLKKKIDYLLENYQKIFTESYPSYADSTLEHPKAQFEKTIGKKMLFTLTCVERSPGSSSRLELQYLYDPESKRWSPYTGQ